MEAFQFLADHAGDSLTTLFAIGSAVVFIEKVISWVSGKFSWYYRKRKGIEDEKDMIKSLSEKMERLVKSQDEQSDALKALEKKMDKIEEDGKRRDCAILRDRILQAVRFFGKNINPNDGQVHIPIAEYENINHLFEEYFGAHGNGTIGKIYTEEFQTWIIDK